MSSVVQNLKLEQISTNGGTQTRTSLNEAAVTEYGEALTDGAKLPPVTVFHDGSAYWLADGFHRFFAHKNIGALDISADVLQGTQRDAILYSVGANAVHGLRRTNDDKRKAVLTLLEDSEWSKWPQTKIAQACGVSREYVSRINVSLNPSCDRSQDTVRTVERDGKGYQQDTANIGKRKSDAPAPERKPARKLEAAPLPEEQMADSDELTEAHDTITELAAENERLMDRLAVGVMDASEDDKTLAAETIAELRQRVHVLEQENDALKASRDTFMSKVAEMQKQINFWKRKADKVAA